MEKTGGRLEEEKDGATAFLPAEYVPAEQNLETIGYFSAGYKRRYPKKPMEAKVLTLGPQRQVRIVPSTYGYPNSEDLDFYRAFLKICHEQTTLVARGRNGHRTLHPHLQLPIGFHTRELIRNTGREKSARELEAVREWIERSTFTGIKGELYRAKIKEFDAAFGGSLFSQFVRVGEKTRTGKVADRNYVWLAPWFLSNYYYHYFRRVDLAFHCRLRKAIAKTLYPLLDTGWYAAQGKPYAKRYADLCAILFIPTYRDVSRVKQQLDPSHEELKREGFLAAWEYLLDRHGKWTRVIRWWPGPKWFHDQEQRKLRQERADRVDHASILPTALPLPAAAPAPPRQLPLPPAVPVARSSSDQTSHAYTELIEDFYAKLGQPRISRHKLDKDLQLLVNLADSQGQRFSLEEIASAMAWIVSHKEDRFGGKVYSLSLLPEVIGEALQTTAKSKKAAEEKQRQQTEEQQIRAEYARRQDLEGRYVSLPPAERTALHEQAVIRLVRQGFHRAVLVETLVRSEVYRLLEERDTLQGMDHILLEAESHSGGLEGGQLPTAVAEVCG